MVEPVNGNKIAALQQTLHQRGMGRVLVIKPGQATFKGVESLKRLPNLYEKLAGFISQKFGIQVVDILSDVDGLLPILAADPSFMERISNSGGNLEVLGHTVVWEMEGENSGKLYLLKNDDNVCLASPNSIGTDQSGDPVTSNLLWEAVQKIRDPDSLRNKRFEVGSCTIEIGDPDPANFTFKIIDVAKNISQGVLDLGRATLHCAIKKDGIVLFQLSDGVSVLAINTLKYDPDEVCCQTWKWGGATYKIEYLYFRPIAQALLKVIEEAQCLPPTASEFFKRQFELVIWGNERKSGFQEKSRELFKRIDDLIAAGITSSDELNQIIEFLCTTDENTRQGQTDILLRNSNIRLLYEMNRGGRFPWPVESLFVLDEQGSRKLIYSYIYGVS
jgi:hypothetical protein